MDIHASGSQLSRLLFVYTVLIIGHSPWAHARAVTGLSIHHWRLRGTASFLTMASCCVGDHHLGYGVARWPQQEYL
jgi:hypothetical protein